MSKQLNKRLLKSEYDKYKEKIDIPVSVGDEEFTVKLTPFFMPKKVDQLIADMSTFYKKAKLEKLVIEERYENDILSYFILRQFTDIKFTKSEKAKMIHEEFETVLNSQICKKIFELIPKESIESVYNRLYELIDLNKTLYKQQETITEDFKGLTLENEFLKDRIEQAEKHD